MSRLGQLTGTTSRVTDIVSFVRGGVNNMMNTPSKDLRVTKLVSSIMDIKASPETEGYLYFDPKVRYNNYLNFFLFIINNANLDSGWSFW